MARVALAAGSTVVIPVAGYNFTDSADFDTLTTGADNGVYFTFNANDQVWLKNATGGAATFTIKTYQKASYAGKAIIGDEDVVIADGKEWQYQVTDIFRQANLQVWIDCDVAGQVLILRKG